MSNKVAKGRAWVRDPDRTRGLVRYLRHPSTTLSDLCFSVGGTGLAPEQGCAFPDLPPSSGSPDTPGSDPARGRSMICSCA